MIFSEDLASQALSGSEWARIGAKEASSELFRVKWLAEHNAATQLEPADISGKNLIFDVMYTLLDLRRVSKGMDALARAYSVTPERIAESQEQYAKPFELGLISEVDRAELMLEMLGQPVAPGKGKFVAERFIGEEISSFVRFIKPYPYVLQTLRALRERGHQIAICSNANPLGKQIMEHHGLFDKALVHEVVLSCEQNTAKPMDQMYQVACNAIHADPNTAIFVDDGGNHSLEGAMKFGLGAVVRIDNPGGYAHQNNGRVAAHHYISSLPDLLAGQVQLP